MLQLIKQSKDGKDTYELLKQDAPVCTCDLKTDLQLIINENEDFTTSKWFWCKECFNTFYVYDNPDKFWVC